jgi:hypothetical protein
MNVIRKPAAAQQTVNVATRTTLAPHKERTALSCNSFSMYPELVGEKSPFRSSRFGSGGFECNVVTAVNSGLPCQLGAIAIASGLGAKTKRLHVTASRQGANVFRGNVKIVAILQGASLHWDAE